MPNTDRDDEQSGGAAFTGTFVIIKARGQSTTLMHFICIVMSGDFAGGNIRRQVPSLESRNEYLPMDKTPSGGWAWRIQMKAPFLITVETYLEKPGISG